MSGISFSTPLVLSLLSGDKSQTRRIINPQPFPVGGPFYRPFPMTEPRQWHSVSKAGTIANIQTVPYAIGDRLYVKEGIERGELGEIVYRADGQSVPGSEWAWKPRTLPHRYMPKGLARLWITVTNVRIERLQDITFADMLAEGVRRAAGNLPGDAWRQLWDGLHDKDGERWADNPWLVALTFTVERNADV